MSQSKKVLLSLGAALATRKLVSLFSDVNLDDVLRPVGLARRRSHWGESFLTLGVGIIVGGTAALLIAPSSGKDMRARLAEKAKSLSEDAARQVNETLENAHSDSDSQGSRINFGGPHPSL